MENSAHAMKTTRILRAATRAKPGGYQILANANLMAAESRSDRSLLPIRREDAFDVCPSQRFIEGRSESRARLS